MRGFGPRMSKILDVFVRKVYVVHRSSNSCERFHSSSSEFLIFWDTFLDGLAHPFPTKLKLAQVFFSANLERAFAPWPFCFYF